MPINLPQPPLRDLADACGMLVGTEWNIRAADTDPDYERVLVEQFNVVVAGTMMKMKATHPEPDRFDFAPAERMMALAKGHGMKVRGHTLVWHHPASLPDWLGRWVDRPAELKQILREHITTVVGHFRGRVLAWDVINEPFHEDRPRRGDSPWQNALGDGYLEMALQWAHEADPDALLFINDYEMDGLNAKADAAYECARDLLSRGAPLHGIGLQGHIRLDRLPHRLSVAENIRRFNDLGLTVHLTEMDVWVPASGGAGTLTAQAEVYEEIFAAARAAADCPAVLLWGFTDRYSWVGGFTNNRWGKALPLDDQYGPKPAWHAIRRALGDGDGKKKAAAAGR